MFFQRGAYLPWRSIDDRNWGPGRPCWILFFGRAWPLGWKAPRAHTIVFLGRDEPSKRDVAVGKPRSKTLRTPAENAGLKTFFRSVAIPSFSVHQSVRMTEPREAARHWLPDNCRLDLTELELGALLAILHEARRYGMGAAIIAKPDSNGQPISISIISRLIERVEMSMARLRTRFATGFATVEVRKDNRILLKCSPVNLINFAMMSERLPNHLTMQRLSFPYDVVVTIESPDCSCTEHVDHIVEEDYE